MKIMLAITKTIRLTSYLIIFIACGYSLVQVNYALVRVDDQLEQVRANREVLIAISKSDSTSSNALRLLEEQNKSDLFEYQNLSGTLDPVVNILISVLLIFVIILGISLVEKRLVRQNTNKI
jgi:hypothetical protein